MPSYQTTKPIKLRSISLRTPALHNLNAYGNCSKKIINLQVTTNAKKCQLKHLDFKIKIRYKSVSYPNAVNRKV